MSLFAVSDLHIQGPDDPLYGSVLALIRDKAGSGDTVVLAGNVFDLFVGNKQIFLDRYAVFFREVKSACARGVKIHYIEGNHDFLMRRVFEGVKGFSHYSHDFSLDIAGKRFFFIHGDTVNKYDYGYRALRMVFRSIPMKALIRFVPGRWVDSVGQLKSRASRMRSQASVADLEGLRNIYRSFAAERLAQGYDFVVMGHCHDLDEMSFIIDGRPGQYVNIGYPRVHGSFLSWSPGDEKIQRERLPL